MSFLDLNKNLDDILEQQQEDSSEQNLIVNRNPWNNFLTGGTTTADTTSTTPPPPSPKDTIINPPPPPTPGSKDITYGEDKDKTDNTEKTGTELGTGTISGNIGGVFDKPTTPTTDDPTAGVHAGFQDILGTKWGEFKDYFEEYDPTRQTAIEKDYLTDVGQLQGAWGLKSGQLADTWTQQQEQITSRRDEAGSLWDLQKGELERQSAGAGSVWGLQEAELQRQGGAAGRLWGLQRNELSRGLTEAKDLWGLQQAGLGRRTQGAREAYGLQRGEMGAQARSALGRSRREGAGARRKSGLAFSGTVAGMERESRGDVYGAYERGLQGGRATLGQTLAGIGEQRAMGQEQLSQRLAGNT